MSNTATSFRQNGQPLIVTYRQLDKQRRQIRNARVRAEFHAQFPDVVRLGRVLGCKGDKGLERQLYSKLVAA